MGCRLEEKQGELVFHMSCSSAEGELVFHKSCNLAVEEQVFRKMKLVQLVEWEVCMKLYLQEGCKTMTVGCRWETQLAECKQVLELEQVDCILVALVLRTMRLNCMTVQERPVHCKELVENCKKELVLVPEDCMQGAQVHRK